MSHWLVMGEEKAQCGHRAGPARSLQQLRSPRACVPPPCQRGGTHSPGALPWRLGRLVGHLDPDDGVKIADWLSHHSIPWLNIANTAHIGIGATQHNPVQSGLARKYPVPELRSVQIMRANRVKDVDPPQGASR